MYIYILTTFVNGIFTSNMAFTNEKEALEEANKYSAENECLELDGDLKENLILDVLLKSPVGNKIHLFITKTEIKSSNNVPFGHEYWKQEARLHLENIESKELCELTNEQMDDLCDYIATEIYENNPEWIWEQINWTFEEYMNRGIQKFLQTNNQEGNL